MSNPTSCLLFPPNNDILQPLYSFLLQTARNPRALLLQQSLLTTLGVHLAHLAFHPAVQNRLAQLPAVTQLERWNFAFGDVAIERVRADAQILRRLPHIHHFARFAHDKTPLRRQPFFSFVLKREDVHREAKTRPTLYC